MIVGHAGDSKVLFLVIRGMRLCRRELISFVIKLHLTKISLPLSLKEIEIVP